MALERIFESFNVKTISIANTEMSSLRYIAIFCACGNDLDAIQASWEDQDTTKTFWRGLFEKSKCRYPRQLAHWDGKNIDKSHKMDCSVVIKLEDSYLGIGDSFLTYTYFSTSPMLWIEIWKRFSNRTRHY